LAPGLHPGTSNPGKSPGQLCFILAEFCFKMARKRVLFGFFSQQISKKKFVSKRVPEFISISYH
jgi:hypothetical protein